MLISDVTLSMVSHGRMVGNYLADDCQVFLADNNAKHSDFIEGASLVDEWTN